MQHLEAEVALHGAVLSPLAAPPAGLRRDPASARHRPLRIGTRASPLALWQARHFTALVAGFCPILRIGGVFEECALSTSGDRILDRRLADIGGKGLFAKELHEALLDCRVDLVVHSLKDLETELPPGIVLACALKREDARDALILGPSCGRPGEASGDPDDPWACLPRGAVVGTASSRRQGQLLHARPDLRVQMLRGNVQTRLARVRAVGDPAASMLALAGLRRLGLEAEAGLVLDPEVMVPAAGQGIVAVTVRAEDVELRALLAAIADPEAQAVATAERELLRALDGSCRTPIGGHARLLPGGGLRLTGLVARPDGSFLLRRVAEGRAVDAAAIGLALGTALRRDSPIDLFG
ncbi:hydroxymethylbilane synthase [Roseicella frigidaeris]|uniref:hydroxymethylbilane synthase n=1 Tax=Roseicella frigidaeris TaxID=2230885 RepID=UPI0038D06635